MTTLQRRSVVYESGDVKIDLVVSEASALTGMRRALLRGRASAYLNSLNGAGGEESEDDKPSLSALDLSAITLMARVVYPDLVAAAVEADGIDLEMSIDDFCGLPDSLVDAWEVAVYQLNPHWLPSQPENEVEEEEEKKKGAPSG